MSLVTLAAATAGHIRYADLPLSPVAFHAWIFTIRWYGLPIWRESSSAGGI